MQTLLAYLLITLTFLQTGLSVSTTVSYEDYNDYGIDDVYYEEEIQGEWVIHQDAEVPDALTEAMKSIDYDWWTDGERLEPICLLGSRVNSESTDYTLLCKKYASGSDVVNDWVLATVNVRTDGNANLTSLTYSGMVEQVWEDINNDPLEPETDYNEDMTQTIVHLACTEQTGTEWNTILDENSSLEYVSGQYIPFDEPENEVIGEYLVTLACKKDESGYIAMDEVTVVFESMARTSQDEACGYAELQFTTYDDGMLYTYAATWGTHTESDE